MTVRTGPSPHPFPQGLLYLDRIICFENLSFIFKSVTFQAQALLPNELASF